jgi:PAS domain S-box-containing protein
MSVVASPFRVPNVLSARRRPGSSVLTLLGAVVLVALVCFSLYDRESNEIQSNLLDRESRRMEIFGHLVAEDFQSVAKDVRQFADGDGLQAYLLSGQQADLDRAIHRAWFFSRENPDYDQIRYLNENGREVVRVDRHGVVVPPEKLQDKSDRSYFKAAMGLARDQIYISAFDLNVENGKVEQPPKPMIRVAMPVFDANGRKRGIVVINYLGTSVLQQLVDFTPQYRQRLRVLNAEGYWIKGAQADQEWGFMWPEKQGMTLARTDPALWSVVSRNSEGQVPHAGGYFTWRKVFPAASVGDKPEQVVTGDPFLVVASDLSPQEFAGYFMALRQTFLVVGIVLLLLVILSWSFLRARRRAQEELDRFFTLTRDLLCVAGFDGYFKRVNPAWERTFGYTPEEFLARPFREYLHPDDLEKTLLAYRGLKNGGEVVGLENRYRCKDGSYRWLLWSARALVGEQSIFASARDLTERKRMEESLRQSEERSRSIIEGALDAFISIDEEGRILDWNLQAEKIFGWSHAEAMGRFLHEVLIPQRYREAHLRGIRHLKETGEGPVLNQRIELTAINRAGKEFPVEIAIWPLKMGQTTTFNAFIADITVRKEAEERIQKLNEERKRRAEQLEAANNELEAFSYSVSHDLRAPLRHIHGFIQLLEESPSLKDDATGQRYMKIVARAAKEMGGLIDDLLAFSRTGRAQINPATIDFRPMIDRAIEELDSDTKGRKIVWKIGPLPGVKGDPSLLRLVWINLISNALKYTRPRAESIIEIGCQTTDPGAREMTFYIRDNGVGFDMRYAANLFGVFQRLHRREEFEGTGIGLANVQRIIVRHGGRVWAESAPDAGATFFFTLPVEISSAIP